MIDLDINRIESVTLLKDAAAKAIYGSKAANGVMVIETVRVQSGELRVNYIGSLNLEMPDLSSYNLCNAREKLDLEFNWVLMKGSLPSRILRKNNCITIIWLKLSKGKHGLVVETLRNGIGHKHSLNLEVGRVN